MLNGEIEKKKDKKSDLSQPELACQTCHPGREVRITL
jgi:hypothetical protein